jgi:hypothetical protein
LFILKFPEKVTAHSVIDGQKTKTVIIIKFNPDLVHNDIKNNITQKSKYIRYIGVIFIRVADDDDDEKGVEGY